MISNLLTITCGHRLKSHSSVSTLKEVAADINTSRIHSGKETQVPFSLKLLGREDNDIKSFCAAPRTVLYSSPLPQEPCVCAKSLQSDSV